jgi:esterase
MSLYFRELGEGDPIVIMHGVFGTSDNWLTVSKSLSEGFKIYLLDLRNHGQSFHSNEFNYEVMSQDLDKFLREQNILDPVIIGHSMGGKVAMKFACDYTNYSKLIVVDISPRYYKRHHDEILKGLNALPLDSLSTRQEADQMLSGFVAEQGVRQFLLKNLYRDENNKFAWRLNLPVITEKIDDVGEALDEHVRIDKPTLFIKGSASRYIKEADEVLIRKIFSNVQIETIEGAGHWVQAEKPKEFAEAVRRFLKK